MRCDAMRCDARCTAIRMGQPCVLQSTCATRHAA
jgi:hypothetical protein